MHPATEQSICSWLGEGNVDGGQAGAVVEVGAERSLGVPGHVGYRCRIQTDSKRLQLPPAGSWQILTAPRAALGTPKAIVV